MVRQSKILFLDEATSSVDFETDRLIQETIINEFGSGKSTVLIIAHRLDSILGCDRVLVMENGRVAEYGTPINLLRDRNSLFAKLVHAQNADKSVLQSI